MSVSVRVPTVLRKQTGGEARLAVEGATVREVLRSLGEAHPELIERITDDDGEVKRFLNVFVNGTDVRYEDELETPVGEGDEVSIVPSIAGGRLR